MIGKAGGATPTFLQQGQSPLAACYTLSRTQLVHSLAELVARTPLDATREDTIQQYPYRHMALKCVLCRWWSRFCQEVLSDLLAVYAVTLPCQSFLGRMAGRNACMVILCSGPLFLRVAKQQAEYDNLMDIYLPDFEWGSIFGQRRWYELPPCVPA